MGGPRDARRGAPVTALLLKYRRLCAKYAALVRRVESRVERRSAIQQLGRWGMKAVPGALALVVRGRIRLANRLFYELAQRGRWAREGVTFDGPKREGELLRGIVLEETAEFERRGLVSHDAPRDQPVCRDRPRAPARRRQHPAGIPPSALRRQPAR